MEFYLNLICFLLLGYCIFKFVMFYFMFYVYNSFVVKVLCCVNGFIMINLYCLCMLYIYVFIKYIRGIFFVFYYVVFFVIIWFVVDVIIFMGIFFIFLFNV